MSCSDCSPKPGQHAKRVEILSRQRVFDGFFLIDAYRLQHETWSGTMTPPLERLVFERGDSVAVLPFDPVHRQVVLVNQFRLPAHVREGQGWLCEMIAGMLDEGKSPEEMVRQEALEEAGYVLGPLTHISTVYPSAGACSERIYLYVAPVDIGSRIGPGGGLEEHGEDIQISIVTLEVALQMISDGRLQDAKAIIALQYLALHWDELATSVPDSMGG